MKKHMAVNSRKTDTFCDICKKRTGKTGENRKILRCLQVKKMIYCEKTFTKV